MAKDYAKAFYNSKAWKKCRTAYIDYRKTVDGGMCETCHKNPGFIVHHKCWISPQNINNPEVTLNHKNLKYDCQTCHNKEKEEEEKEKYFFGEDGQLYPTPP